MVRNEKRLYSQSFPSFCREWENSESRVPDYNEPTSLEADKSDDQQTSEEASKSANKQTSEKASKSDDQQTNEEASKSADEQTSVEASKSANKQLGHLHFYIMRREN